MHKPVVMIVDGGSGWPMAATLAGVLIDHGYSTTHMDVGHVRVAGRGLPGDPPDVLDLPHTVLGQRLIGAGQAGRRPVAPYQPVGSKRRHRRNGAKLFARCCAEGVVGAGVVTPEMEAR